ncbi:MAG TPA: SPOR domain-containing protein [Geminicoccaceae bacterium]|nr:SPOR domain-containing protein [Geminicoccus sp.]HMU52429.1 SPOR domain-containing protein [Geminicoccaceae bacterium]
MSSNAAQSGGFGRWIVIALGGVVFAVFAAVIWYAYVEVMGLGAGGPPPLVRAEAGPIKRAPDDPGGMEIPNRDAAVARVFEETSDGVRRERILPPQDTTQVPPEPDPPPSAAPQPEAASTVPATDGQPPAAEVPVERLAAPEPEPPAAVPAPTPPASRPTITVTSQPPPTQATTPPTEQTAPRPLTPPAAAARPPAQVAPRPAAQPAQPRVVTPPSPPQQQAARTPPAATPPARSAPAAGPTFRVQLGAFRSDSAANQAWNLLQSKLGGTLGGLRPTVLEARTSAGTFYRLQAGPLPDRDGAVRTCSQVKAAGNDCFIVGPLP